jgi:hypothetical protein
VAQSHAHSVEILIELVEPAHGQRVCPLHSRDGEPELGFGVSFARLGFGEHLFSLRPGHGLRAANPGADP